MDKVKIKVIGVLKDKGGGTANVVNHRHQPIQQQHQVAVGVSAAASTIAAVVNGSGGINSAAQDNTATATTTTATATATLNVQQNGMDEQSGTMEGGAARTTVISVSRPQLPKLSEIDLAGIINTRRRLEWTKDWLRKNQTEFLSRENIMSEMHFRNNENYHLNYFLAITESQFRYLVQRLEPEISQYAPQRKKKSFSAEERLAITLKYLATGEVHSCRNYCFRASKLVIFKMIANICFSFFTLLKDQYLQLPKTDEHWQKLAAGMQHKHDTLPQCVGNVFMREIQFHNANGSGSNTSSNSSGSAASSSTAASTDDLRKHTPLIFGGAVDSDNNFLHIDLQFTPAKAHNEIFEHATLKESLEKHMLPAISANNAIISCSNSSSSSNGTPPGSIDGSDVVYSYYFVGDKALPQKSYMVTAQNVNAEFAKHLDVVNVHTEQTLRILCNMFPILAQPLRINAQHTKDIVLGCVALYNFLRKTDASFLQRTNNIVKKPWEPLAPFHNESEQADDSDDDCIMLATEEELRERAEFTPSIGLTTCFQALNAQKGDTAEGLAKRNWLMRQTLNDSSDCY